ncbi:MAG: DUF6179 domain-containing protein [Eubacteriales bacterium]|nr:DUF6179 domain-containing protein [Eubacteriales bacterium]
MIDARDTLAAQPGALADASFSPQETALIQGRLMLLLERQMRLQTQGDSASLPAEEAEELLESVVFTLRFHLEANGLPTRTMLTAELAALFAQAQKTLFGCVAETETLYQTACRTVRLWGSRSLRDTISAIGDDLPFYDARLYAHRPVGEIDYQLCLPVPETLLGIEYLHEYLRRLLTENELLARLSPTRVQALLKRACPEYRQLLQNLYEPVAANVVGLSLLGGGETLLEITGIQAERIAAQLTALPTAEARARLRTAACEACQRLSLTDAFSIDYCGKTAEALYPRIVAAPGSAAGAFAVC